MTCALILFGELDAARSGGFRYDRELVDALEGAGHRVAIVSQPPVARYRDQIALARERRWVETVVDLAPDCVCIDELNHAATYSGIDRLKRRLGPRVPIVAVVHHLRSDERALRVRARILERSFLRSCDAWLCNGVSTLARVQKTACVAHHSAVAMPGRETDTPAISKTGDEHRSEEAERRAVPVLAVGTVEPRKNLHTLVRAAASLEPVTLTIAGTLDADPRYTRRIRTLIARLGVERRVRLTGHVEREELERLYAAAEVFALPSRYEGFGIAYLEAMTNRLPVIATKRGGAADLVRHGIDGRLIDPSSPHAVAAALLELVSNEGERRRCGENAYARAMQIPLWRRSMTGAVRFLETIKARQAMEHHE